MLWWTLFSCGAQPSKLLDTDVVDNTAVDVDADQDGYLASEDCNDGDAMINPGAVEVCDEIDNNCDGNIDENAKDATVSFVTASKDRPEKVSFADEGALRGVSFKDRCWMAGVQARGVEKGNGNAAGKAGCMLGDTKKRKRGKRGGKKNSKKKMRR